MLSKGAFNALLKTIEEPPKHVIFVFATTESDKIPEIFQITAASEIMAILCLAKDMDDLKVRLDRIAIAYDMDGNIVTAGRLGATGALATCLKDAMAPNLVQSLEGVPITHALTSTFSKQRKTPR